MAGDVRRLAEVRSVISPPERVPVEAGLAERLLVIVLRIGGVAMLFATLAIVMPTPWMVQVHAWLGMGELPRAGIMEYLTRSVSALYALHGGLLLVLSRDVRRYAGVITYLGAANIPLGGILLAIDLHAGMPWYWTIAEGPLISVTGIVLLGLVRALPRSQEGPSIAG